MATLAVMAVNVGAQLWAGKQREKLKGAEAEGYRQAARRRMAVAGREASEEIRKKEFVYSRALAVMGVQGASMADPGIQALLADLNAEGDYRVISTLWSGLNDAEAMRYRADVAIQEGEAAVTASYVNAVTSAISTYGAFGGFERDPTTGRLPAMGDVMFGGFTQREQMRRGITAAGKQWGEGTPYATEEEYQSAFDSYLRRHYPGASISR